MGIKHSADNTFFDTWTRESTYIIGLLCADGNLLDVPSIRAKYFSLTSTDVELVEHMRSLLKSHHRFHVREAADNREKAYMLRIGDPVLYDRLLAIGLTPAKSHTLRFPDVPKRLLPDFIRGYFDGDGCAFLEYSKTGVKKLVTIFTCASLSFIEQLETILIARTGVTSAKLYRHGSTINAYQLRYSTRDSLRLFLYLYHPLPKRRLYLKRKYAIFTKYLDLRNLTIEQIPQVLVTTGPVAK